MISIKDQQNLFIEIAKRLPHEITAYAVGGTAMMFLGLKEATKDIDLVFTNKEDRRIFKEAAISLGYKEMDSVIVYGAKNNPPEMLSLGDSRLDLFLFDVIDFAFSESMQKRAEQIHQFGKNLRIRIADVHDIIVMKCATKRAKDEEDVVALAKTAEINWSILVEEAKKQLASGKETAILDLGNLLEKLKGRHKINVPKAVLNDVWSLLKKQIDKKAGWKAEQIAFALAKVKKKLRIREEKPKTAK